MKYFLFIQDTRTGYEEFFMREVTYLSRVKDLLDLYPAPRWKVTVVNGSRVELTQVTPIAGGESELGFRYVKD